MLISIFKLIYILYIVRYNIILVLNMQSFNYNKDYVKFYGIEDLVGRELGYSCQRGRLIFLQNNMCFYLWS